jgi:iron complex transport system ATP-binding protein
VIFILTGPVHSGKTTLLKKMTQKLKQGEIKMGGFLSESKWKDQDILGYDLLDLSDEKSHPFIRKKGKKGWEKKGPFYFIPETLSLAKQIIRRASNTDICVIDEVGPLELSGKGLWTALKEALRTHSCSLLFVVRISILEKFLSKINRKDIKVFDIQDEDTFAAMLKSLKPEQLRSRHS